MVRSFRIAALAVLGAAVVVPLSGRTMQFDAAGQCTAGC